MDAKTDESAMVIAVLGAVAVVVGLAAVAPAPTRHFTTGRPVEVSRAVGAAVRRIVRRPASAAADRRVGAAVLWAVIGAVTLGPLGLLVGGCRWAVSGVRRHRQQVDETIALWRELPESADLLALCLGAGMAVPMAVAIVGTGLDGPVGSVLAEIDRRHRHGQIYSDAVASAAGATETLLHPFLAIISAAHIDGGPAVDSLHRLAADLREQRRRVAEARARRVPVALLFPLVFCILPAFVLLALVPLVAGSSQGLALP